MAKVMTDDKTGYCSPISILVSCPFLQTDIYLAFLASTVKFNLFFVIPRTTGKQQARKKGSNC